MPAEIRPGVQKLLSEARQSEVRDPKAHLDHLRKQLGELEAGGKKLGEPEINSLVLLESQRLITTAARERIAAFAAQGIPLTESGAERMLIAEAEKLGLSQTDAQGFVDTMLGRTPEVKAQRAEQGKQAWEQLDTDARFYEDLIQGVYSVHLENREGVKAAIEAAYAKGLALPPEVFSQQGLKADPRHQAFMAHLPETLAGQHAPPIEGKVADIDGWRGVASEIERIQTPQGEVYFKPIGEGGNGNKPRGEVLASMANEMMGLDLIPKTRFASFDGKLGSAQDAVPAGFTQGQHVQRESLRTDPLYRDSLADLRAFDYIIAASDRHPGNLFVDTAHGKIMAIDSDSALGKAIPMAEKNRTDSGGVLPEHYTDRMREAVAKMTPEAIHERFKELASPAEIDAMILRVEIVKADILKKHGPDALSFGGGPKPPSVDPMVRDPQTPIPPGTSTTNRPQGPEPLLAPGDSAALATARAKLAEGRALTPADSRAMLADVALSGRQALRNANPGASDARIFSSAEIGGWCGFGQAATFYRLRESGIPAENIHLHQSAEIFGEGSFRHAFLTVDMPDGKSYLVDTTFRQFFEPGQTGPKQIGKPGDVMRQTPEGRMLADGLLRDGFVELNDAVAQAYGEALRGGRPGPPITAEGMRRTTQALDYEPHEVPGLPPLPATGQTGPKPEPMHGSQSSEIKLPRGYEQGKVLIDSQGQEWTITGQGNGVVELSNPHSAYPKYIEKQADVLNYRLKDAPRLPEGFRPYAQVRDAGGGVWQLIGPMRDGTVSLSKPDGERQVRKLGELGDFTPVPETGQRPIENTRNLPDVKADKALAAELGAAEGTPIRVSAILPDGRYRVGFSDGKGGVQTRELPPARLKDLLPTPSDADFKAKYPLGEGDGYPRAFVQLDATDPRDSWRVTGYDAETGLATVSKTQIELVNPANLTEHPLFRHLTHEDIHQGGLVTDLHGQTWRVKEQTESAGSKALLLERVEVQKIRGEQLLKLTPEIQPHYPVQGIGDVVGQVKQEVDTGKRLIEKVGPARVLDVKKAAPREVSFETAQGQPKRKAEIYEVNVLLKDGSKHKIEVAIPAGPEAKTIFRQMQAAIAEMPLKQIAALDQIRVNPTRLEGKGDGNFASAHRLEGNRKGIIDFYPSALGKDGSDGYHHFDIAWHELGHLIASRLFSSGKDTAPIPARNWDAAMSSDVGRNHAAGKHGFVSDYAKTNIKEDFAETVMLYLATDGGRIAPPAHMAERLKLGSGEAVREQFRDRFLVLDKYFESHPGEIANLRSSLPDALKSMALGLGALGIAGKFVYRQAQDSEDKP